MSPFILNPALLAGLLGIGLPVLAHLLSRRKFDVVQWGAMQFLNPSRKTRRRMRLEEMLLLFVRMAAVAIVVLALCRFSVSSGMLLGYHSAGSRDVVLVIDGSNSMGRSDGLTSLHDKAIRRAQTFLKTLNSGDTISIIDARDTTIRMMDSAVTDRELAHQTLEAIPPAAGAGDLQRACSEAVAMLGRCSNASREVVVFTDRQRAGWAATDDATWKRFDEILDFPVVRPKVWVVDMSAGLGPIRQNVSTGKVVVSRDLTVPGFPVSFQVPIHNAGTASVTVPIQVLLDGQRLAGLDSEVVVPAGSETLFSRSIRFTKAGTSIVGVRAALPEDAVEVDNASFSAVQVTSAIPVLLVESADQKRRSKQNTFFAELALSPPGNKSPWVNARRVNAAELTAAHLDTVSAIVLPDVVDLPEGLPSAIRKFAAAGNGVFISLGPETTAKNFERLYVKSRIFPPLKLNRIRTSSATAAVATTVAPYSIEGGWLQRFKDREGAALMTAPFEQWWLVEHQGTANPNASGSKTADEESTGVVSVARLTSGDPLLLQASCGRGTVLLMTSNIDAEWNALPSTPDYVPFIHEALFQLASAKISRNVDFSEPLVTVFSTDANGKLADEFQFLTPFDIAEKANVSATDAGRIVQLPTTRLPGVYNLFAGATVVENAEPLDSFVVNYDHTEDDPAELTKDDLERLVVNERLTFVDSVDALQKKMYAGESRSELWALLLWLFLGLLMFEVWMTRRLVKKGHVVEA